MYDEHDSAVRLQAGVLPTRPVTYGFRKVPLQSWFSQILKTRFDTARARPVRRLLRGCDLVPFLPPIKPQKL